MTIKEMKLTKDRFSTWEDSNDKDYDIEFDDELIIKVYPNESSKDIADYILSLQEENISLKAHCLANDVKIFEYKSKYEDKKLTGTPRKHPYCLICKEMYMDFCMLHGHIQGSYEMRVNDD